MSFSSSLESSSRAESFAPVQAKTIIVGDTTVGKSSIIWQYLAKDFKYNMPLTVGI